MKSLNKLVNRLEGSTPTSTRTVVYFVKWKSKSPNRLLKKHWTVIVRNTKGAREGNLSALLSSPHVAQFLTTIITWALSNPSETPSPAASCSTTATPALGGNMDSAKAREPRE